MTTLGLRYNLAGRALGLKETDSGLFINKPYGLLNTACNVPQHGPLWPEKKNTDQMDFIELQKIPLLFPKQQHKFFLSTYGTLSNKPFWDSNQINKYTKLNFYQSSKPKHFKQTELGKITNTQILN